MASVRDEKGRIKKGHSLNISGRPKTDKLTATDKKQLAVLFKECVKTKDLSKLIVWLVSRSTNTQEVFRITKEFAKYIVPTLSASKVEENKTTELRITFAGDEEPIKIANPVIVGEIENESK